MGPQYPTAFRSKFLELGHDKKAGDDMTLGEVTRKLGEELESLEKHELKVFYDHGDSHNQHVCEPRLYFGDYFLAVVDIVVLDHNNRVKAICEIEDRGASPKKIFGDIVGIFLANEIRIKKNDIQRIDINDSYYIKNPFFFILGVLETADEVDKLRKRAQNIKNQIQSLISRNRIKIEDPICESNGNIKGFKEKVKEKISVALAPPKKNANV